MITKRIIPCLDIKNGRVVKGTNFQGLSDVSSPIELAKIYSPEGARAFDFAMMGRIYSNKMQIVSCAYADAPKAKAAKTR